jgi:hypothetical protein
MLQMSGYGKLYALVNSLSQLLASRIYKKFTVGNEISKFFAVLLISIFNL